MIPSVTNIPPAVISTSDRNNNIDVKLIAYVEYVFGKLGLDKYFSVVVAVNVCVSVQPVPAENNKNE
jgi:hypothetical protein